MTGMANDVGIVLNGETSRWLRAATSSQGAAAETLDASRRRRMGLSDALAEEFSRKPDERVTLRRHVVGPHRIRVHEFRPSDTGDARSAYVYLHGGAFWHGSIDERVNVALLAERVARTGVGAYAVEYRLAPEHPYPAAIEDTVHIVEWLRETGGEMADRIVLGGVSAGANIAAAAAGRLVSSGLLSGLILEVPAIDLRVDGSWDERFASINGLNSPDEMNQLYAPRVGADDAEISPVLIGRLDGFPPTHVVTAEYDPHRSGGEILTRRLRSAGVTVTGARHLGALHGSLGLTARDPIAIAWQDDVCGAIRRLVSDRGAAGSPR